MHTLLLLTIFTAYDFLGPPPAPVREEVQTVLKDPSIETWIRGLISEILDARKEEEETEKLLEAIEPSDPPEVKVRTDLTEVPVPLLETEPPALKPLYKLNVYTFAGCQPCGRMLDELTAKDPPFDWAEYPYPQYTFHDGSLIPSFPAAELFREGKLVKRYLGYTSVEVIIQDITLAEGPYGENQKTD